MLDVQYPNDCGNAPKKKVILALNIAFAKGDVEGVRAFLAPDAIWEMVGDKVLHGHEEIVNSLREMAGYQARKLELLQIITHGKDASARGVLEFANNRVRFADFYEFTSAGSSKLKRITSFAMDEHF